MSRRVCVFVFFLLFIVVQLGAASSEGLKKGNIIPYLRKMIYARKFDQALKEIRQFLKKYPRNVNARMMKGNVLFHKLYQPQRQASMMMIADNDESIFVEKNERRMVMGAPKKPTIVSPKLAQRVAAIWKKCLTIDPSRLDIYRGICWMYSQAGMEKEAYAAMKLLHQKFSKQQDLAYNLGDYARMFIDRKWFAKGMRLYRWVIKKYPKMTGLYSDIAWRCFQDKRYGYAEKYVTLASQLEIEDFKVAIVCGIIFDFLGQHDQALRMLKKMSSFRKTSFWRLYKGLLMLHRGVNGWKAQVKKYVSEEGVKDDGRPVSKFIHFLLKEKVQGRESIQKMVSLASACNDGLYQLFALRIARKKYPHNFSTYYNLGMLYSGHESYGQGLKLCATFSVKNLSSIKEKERYQMMYAWFLQKSGNLKQANIFWKKLFNSSSPFRKLGSRYFYALNLLRNKKKQAAKAILLNLSQQKGEIKYIEYAKRAVEALKTGDTFVNEPMHYPMYIVDPKKK